MKSTPSNTGNSKKTWLAIIITAMAASLCCITPVLAFLAGISGMASAFSWLEPLRPFFLIMTMIIIAFAWYQKLKPNMVKEEDCGCDIPAGKTSFFHTKSFLAILTIFAFLMVTFPYYSQIFYPKKTSQESIVSSDKVQQAHLKINGMTCQGCEENIKQAAYSVNGVIDVQSSYKTGNTVIKFDNSKTSIDEIVKAVNSTGYKVSNQQIK